MGDTSNLVAALQGSRACRIFTAWSHRNESLPNALSMTCLFYPTYIFPVGLECRGWSSGVAYELTTGMYRDWVGLTRTPSFF